MVDRDEELARLYRRDEALPPDARDMFAAYALPAIATTMDLRRTGDVAALAYSIADAMMAERKARYAGK